MTESMVAFNMHFKRHALICSLVLSLGCNKLFNKSQPVAPPLVPDLGFHAACLNGTVAVMERFVVGTANPAEVTAVWTCFGGAISLFEKKVRGSEQTGFTGREVATFFEDRFLGDVKISDGFLSQIMLIKQVFVGGSSEVISKPELLQLVQFANAMQDLSVKLLPYMKLYSLNWQPQPQDNPRANVEYFENANSTLQAAASQVIQMILVNNPTYDLRNLNSLLDEVEKLAASSWSWLPAFHSDFSVVEKIKSTLLGGDPDLIQPGEWARLGSLASRGYIQYLRYYYFIQHADQTGPQFVYFTNSLSELFGFLGDMVQSRPTGQLTKGELTDLLTSLNLVFKTVNFTPELVDQGLNIKALVLGGDAQTFLPQDFVVARKKIDNFRIVLERIWAFAPFYAGTWNPSELSAAQAHDYFAAGEDNLKSLASTLSLLMSGDYELENLLPLANGLSNLIVDPKQKFSWAQSLALDVPLVIASKKIISGDDRSVVTQAQWAPIASLVADFYSRVLYWNYFVKPGPLSTGPGLIEFDNFAGQIVQSLQALLLRQADAAGDPNKAFISYAKLQDLVAGLGQSGLLGSLKPASLPPLVSTLFNRILVDPNQRLAGTTVLGFGSGGLNQLKMEYDLWSSNQHLLETLVAAHPEGLTQADLQKSFAALNPQTRGAIELQAIIQGQPNLIFNSNGRIVFSGKSTLYDQDTLSFTNGARALSRLLINSYVEDVTRFRSDQGLVVAEVNTAFADFKPLAVDLGILSNNNSTFASSRFFEANIFTPVGDGNNLLNLGELTQEVELLLSGLNISHEISKGIDQNCNPNADGSSNIDDILSVTCVLRLYDQSFASIYSQAPEMVASFQSLSPAMRNTLFVNYLLTAGPVNVAADKVSRADVSLMPYVFQYAESLLQRYDSGHKGFLDDTDAQNAYPSFSSLITQFSNSNISIINQAAFMYILKNGTIPSGFWDLLGDLWNLFWHSPEGVHADRMQLAKILAAIENAIRGPSAALAGPHRDLNPPAGVSFPFLAPGSETAH